MPFTLPFVPGTGAVGRVSAIGPGSTNTEVGAWVYCDPTLRVRDGHGLPAIALQGLTANGLAAMAVQRQYLNGSGAQKLRLPLENITKVGEFEAADAARLLRLRSNLVESVPELFTIDQPSWAAALLLAERRA